MNYDVSLDEILKSNNGFIKTKDLTSKGIPTVYLTRYVRKHDLIKVAPGFYAERNWTIDGYYLLQQSFPGFVFSFSSAIFLHGLGDIMPPYYEVTGPKNYRPMKNKRIDVVTHTDTRKETYSLGVCSVKTAFGNPVNAYDMEKTICDLIRFKRNMDIEVFVKAIHAYSKRPDKNLNKLYKYAVIMGIEEKVASIMEVALNED